MAKKEETKTAKPAATKAPAKAAPAEASGQADTAARGLKKSREGYVESNKMTKTVVVTITTKKRHADYGKFVQRTKHYMAHDEKNECQIGDRVRIIETRPLSRLKRWRVVEILERAA